VHWSVTLSKQYGLSTSKAVDKAVCKLLKTIIGLP
jgi:hypothetical protein